MMLAAKPISSLGRSDKFPPPLMRFLRSNAGNKSRASRRKKPNTNSTSAAAASVEPSSPKVTCMGQVRVRRGTAVSLRPGKARRAGAPAREKRFRWAQASFCSDFPGRIKPKSSCGELWRKWVPFFQGGSCSKAQVDLQVSPEKMETRESLGFSSDEEEEELGFQRKEKAFGFVDTSSCSPPKNALLLTRCRSAPYRSSSLACRFWGSPNRAQEKTEEEEEKQSKTEQEEEESIENLGPKSERESILHEESKTEKPNEEKIELLVNERVAKSAASIEDLRSSSEWPLILTRCKSEPARTTTEKLNPDSFIHSHQVSVIREILTWGNPLGHTNINPPRIRFY